MTAERPSESLQLTQLWGLHYITEDRAQAESVACAAVNYMFPVTGKTYVPADLQSRSIDPTSEYVSKRYFHEGGCYDKYLETNFSQRPGASVVKLTLECQGIFSSRSRSLITRSIEKQTGIDYQPPQRELRRRFDDPDNFTAYLQTDESPISSDFLDSAVRRRVYYNLGERLPKSRAESTEAYLDRYMEASEEERIELLQQTVMRARKKPYKWDQTVVPFGYAKQQRFIHNKTVYHDFAWEGVPDEDVAVRGMVVAEGYYDLETHHFTAAKMNTYSRSEVIAWVAPKHPGPATTEKAFGTRLDEVAYDLGATATSAFKKTYEKQYLHPKPKHIGDRPKKKQLQMRTHQVHRELRPEKSPYKVFFGED